MCLVKCTFPSYSIKKNAKYKLIEPYYVQGSNPLEPTLSYIVFTGPTYQQGSNPTLFKQRKDLKELWLCTNHW
ncbi:MAG: hypothetical protein ACRD6U_09615 [Nitrososphaeraceae archaeon]